MPQIIVRSGQHKSTADPDKPGRVLNSENVAVNGESGFLENTFDDGFETLDLKWHWKLKSTFHDQRLRARCGKTLHSLVQ